MRRMQWRQSRGHRAITPSPREAGEGKVVSLCLNPIVWKKKIVRMRAPSHEMASTQDAHFPSKRRSIVASQRHCRLYTGCSVIVQYIWQYDNDLVCIQKCFFFKLTFTSSEPKECRKTRRKGNSVGGGHGKKVNFMPLFVFGDFVC